MDINGMTPTEALAEAMRHPMIRHRYDIDGAVVSDDGTAILTTIKGVASTVTVTATP